ncbi:hypothetical protein [Desulfovibrio legallii]|jgi:hypothetical protein|uniref:hypothetical protein n=1 Tax=Desulfovibrio legallii TaxID=571438 RepID=UPI0013EF1819|nr:hypothetical protein [Desulfovibrio legallii]DAZ80385.1 MAG TPA: hypothetical protein [Caudoviricetes sp.]
MPIVRTQQEIDRVLNWAAEGIDNGTKFAGMTYEQGITDMHMWLTGETNVAPDSED